MFIVVGMPADVASANAVALQIARGAWSRSVGEEGARRRIVEPELKWLDRR